MGAAGKQYEVVREATVGAPPQVVFDLIADFHHWEQWSPWEDVDPALKRTYAGAEAGVGAVYTWTGNRKAGEGRMEITEAVSPERVAVDLQFIKPFKARTVTTFELAPQDDGTHVTWRMTGPMTMATKVMSIFTSMDKLIGKDFEKGLDRLADAATA